eukprot:Clim_evm232s157 gene=Clim_evmTU232s157
MGFLPVKDDANCTQATQTSSTDGSIRAWDIEDNGGPVFKHALHYPIGHMDIVGNLIAASGLARWIW